jgi:hypothetical protein
MLIVDLFYQLFLVDIGDGQNDLKNDIDLDIHPIEVISYILNMLLP